MDTFRAVVRLSNHRLSGSYRSAEAFARHLVDRKGEPGETYDISIMYGDRPVFLYSHVSASTKPVDHTVSWTDVDTERRHRQTVTGLPAARNLVLEIGGSVSGIMINGKIC